MRGMPGEARPVARERSAAVSVDALADAWEAAWSGGDPRAFAAICAPDLHYEDPLDDDAAAAASPRSPSTPRRLWRAFPDVRFERAGQRLSDGRFAALPVRAHGRNTGPLDGLPASHREIELHVVFWCELDAGRTRLWRVRAVYDAYGAALAARADPAARDAAQPRAADAAGLRAAALRGPAIARETTVLDGWRADDRRRRGCRSNPVRSAPVTMAAARSAVPRRRRGPLTRAARRAAAVGIRARFALALVALALSLGLVGWAGVSALDSGQASLQRIYGDSVITLQKIGRLQTLIGQSEETILYALASDSQSEQQQAGVALNTRIIPTVEVLLAEVSQSVADSPQQTLLARALSDQWATFLSGFAGESLQGQVASVRAAEAATFKIVLDQVSASAGALFNSERTDARTSHHASLASYKTGLRVMVIVVIAGFVASMLVLLWLARLMLPRMLAYSRFAQRLAAGDYRERLEPRGRDEIDGLGRILDTVAQSREDSERHDHRQAEFGEALQVTADEGEAQELLRRHLERSIPGASVVVLNRNNSLDRLQAVTALPAGSPLATTLLDASPRSCLAVRGAHIHERHGDESALVDCAICGGCGGETRCTPLLVGGEVIGSVLVNGPTALDGAAEHHIRESVRQAAPVIANLRNLSMSETRAATDALTGLPNRRSLDDTIKRMVAQAHRTNQPLAALMLDLDHFKQVNDQLGHSRGDEILAAFGIQLHGLLRASDFASRYGGEEFLLLLPATDEAGALTFAERIRAAMRTLPLPFLDRAITISIGLAVLPDHGLDSETLARAADRALYAAKTNGRDRIEIATTDTTPARAHA